MRKLFFLLCATAFMACNNTGNAAADERLNDGVQDLKEGDEMKADTAGAYINEQKEKAIAAIKERKKEIDKKIEALKKDGSGKSAEMRKKLNETRTDLDRKLEEIKSSTADTWGATKQDVDKALDKASREWEGFKSDFKELFK